MFTGHLLGVVGKEETLLIRPGLGLGRKTARIALIKICHISSKIDWKSGCLDTLPPRTHRGSIREKRVEILYSVTKVFATGRESFQLSS